MKTNIAKMLTDNLSCETVRDSDAAFGLRWLGQAGFEVYTGEKHIMIDPYLSDHLAKKYAGKEFAHQRMMDAPIAPEGVTGLDYILTTHRHSDHIDPETTPIIMANNPKCILIAPRSESEHVSSLGIAPDRIIFTNAGEKFEIADNTWVTVIPSAHEELKTDSKGNHHFLGYILSCSGVTIYHSGDCVPFAKQRKLLRENKVDVALLPINGRDEYRTSRGVPGNMKFTEAIELCMESGISQMIGHHFGMFSFNTADMDEVTRETAKVDSEVLNITIPESTATYIIK